MTRLTLNRRTVATRNQGEWIPEKDNLDFENLFVLMENGKLLFWDTLYYYRVSSVHQLLDLMRKQSWNLLLKLDRSVVTIASGVRGGKWKVRLHATDVGKGLRTLLWF